MRQTSLSWARAVVVSALTFLLLVLAFLYVPHWILTAMSAPARGVRVWMATAWIAFALGASCVAGWRSTGSRRPSA